MMTVPKQILLLFSALLFLCVAAEPLGPLLHTKLGSLRGELLTVKGTENKVHAFLGVPFAKPPLGPALRLTPPQPVEAWEGERDATKQPPMCMQNLDLSKDMIKEFWGLETEFPKVSEDCLYMNIFTPATRPHDAKLPVMFWIHGGGFVMGSASMYDGSPLAAYENVVMVIIQYRLGMLGYLSTGDEHMPGNYGMLDQVQALKWIQEHIRDFGGDPNSVTIFGESAGGVSVSMLLLSPMAEGLFHKVIAESGSATLELIFMENALEEITRNVANKSGCSIESTKKIADCMKNQDSETILTIAKDETLRYPIVMDGHFLTKPLKQLWENKEFQTLPFITGVNSDEGGYFLTRYMAPPNWTQGMDKEDISNVLAMFYPDAEIRQLILDTYGASEDRIKNRDAFRTLVGDLLFNAPAVASANALRDAGAPTYFYEFRNPLSFMTSRRPSFVGSDHGDEVFSVFGFCFTDTYVKLPDSCSEDEQKSSRDIMSYWANFARTGSPNGRGLVHWPKYDKEEAYLVFDEEQVVKNHYRTDTYVFLSETLPKKIQQCKEKQNHKEL